MTDDDFEDYFTSCVAEYVALLVGYPVVWGDEPMETQIERYETRIARDAAQITFYRDMAKSAAKPEHRASYLASAEALERLTNRHKAKLAALRGEPVGQLGLFGEAAA